MGLYFVSFVLLMRMNMPRISTDSNRSSGAINSFYQHWFEEVSFLAFYDAVFSYVLNKLQRVGSFNKKYD